MTSLACRNYSKEGMLQLQDKREVKRIRYYPNLREAEEIYLAKKAKRHPLNIFFNCNLGNLCVLYFSLYNRNSLYNRISLYNRSSLYNIAKYCQAMPSFNLVGVLYFCLLIFNYKLLCNL